MTGLEPGAEEGDLQIEPLVVVPEARGSGVGRALVTHLMNVIKEMNLGELNVRVVGRNTGAIQFYHELGFNKIGFFELFFDTRAEADQRWLEGETIAGRRFRV
jgi:ribosomal protein S18 acetylase RimI-like enzyme